MDYENGPETAFARALRLIRHKIATRSKSGDRLLITDLTRSTGLSPTPVREALSRLIGEELVIEQRGGGYYTPRYDQREVAELYTVSCGLGIIAVLEGASIPTNANPLIVAQPSYDPGSADGIAFWMERIAATSANSVLIAEMRRLNQRMAPIRRAEPYLIDGLAGYTESLAKLIEERDIAGQVRWIERYRSIGVAQANTLSAWLCAR